MVNYGDGIYGGMFFTAMYAAAGRRNAASEGVGITLGRVVSYAGRVAELPDSTAEVANRGSR